MARGCRALCFHGWVPIPFFELPTRRGFSAAPSFVLMCPPAVAATWRQIGVFLLLTLAFSAVFWYWIIHTGRLGAGHGLYVTGLMWSPGAAGLITRYLFEGSARNQGWRW